MKLEFIDIPKRKGFATATIHITGKLGINSLGADLMKLTSDSYFKIGIDQSTKDIESLYFVPCNKSDKNSIKASKAGQYFYFNLSSFFSEIRFDFKRLNYTFQICSIQHEGQQIFDFKCKVGNTRVPELANFKSIA